MRGDPVSTADADGHQAAGNAACGETGQPPCSPGDPPSPIVLGQDVQNSTVAREAAQSTVTVARVDTIGTHINQNGTTTTVTQTTTAAFSSARGHEGEFLGATTQATVTVTGTIGGGEPVTF